MHRLFCWLITQTGLIVICCGIVSSTEGKSENLIKNNRHVHINSIVRAVSSMILFGSYLFSVASLFLPSLALTTTELMTAFLSVLSKQSFENRAADEIYLFFCVLTQLTHFILVDSSTVTCWTSPFVILGMSLYFISFMVFLMESPVSKQYRP